MLETLDQVDWSGLHHCYGSAADVPEMLRACLDPDPQVRFAARDGMHAALDHQGVQRFESTYRAVPFLIELLGNPDTPDRAQLARLLAELAVGDTCWFLHDGVHRERQTRIDDCARANHVATIRSRDFSTRAFPRLAHDELDLSPGSGLLVIYDAVAAGLPVYLGALDGADDDLRAAIPFLCGFLTGDSEAADSAGPLTALLDDRVERVRASAALGLSHACKFVPSRREAAFAALSARWDRPLGALERRCLALALVRFEDPPRTAAARAHLRDELARGLPAVAPPNAPGAAWPWFRIDSMPFVFCTTYLGTAEDARGELAAPACAGLRTLAHEHDAADLALWMVKLWSDDRDVLAAIAATPAAWVFTDVSNELYERGLPDTQEALAKDVIASGA
jgi:hypothetical protein